MEKIIGSCGIVCSDCPAYAATSQNDDALRKSTAENWSKMFNATLQPEDIHCLGCHSDVLFSYCGTCKIRECSNTNSVENCSKCGNYACDTLEEFFKLAPDAKKVLDDLR